MQYPNDNMIYRLIVLLFLICLIEGCSSDSHEKAIEQKPRKIISFKSYDDRRDESKNSIYIELNDSCKSDLTSIKVRLTHGSGCKPMSNFVLTISTDNNGYWLLMNNFRFLENEFNSLNDTVIEKDINLNLCSIRSYTDSALSYSELRNKINSTKRLAIRATMNDMTLMENPLSSSSLRHSNLIEIIY